MHMSMMHMYDAYVMHMMHGMMHDAL
jgi:hypothetical protein